MDDSSSSTELCLEVADTLEFTLEDTLGMLKELKLERDQALDRIYDVQINNQLFESLGSSANVLEKQQELVSSFINEVSNERPDDYPIPNTVDMFTNVIGGLSNEIQDIQERIDIATKKLKRKEEDISRLREKRKSFERMKEACLTANKIIASKTYEQEIRITNEIFKQVKSETHQVVAEIFPDDDHMRNFLAELCSAYFSSGDDVYIDLEPEYADAANFLVEAAVIVYHPYDTNKVRLIDL